MDSGLYIHLVFHIDLDSDMDSVSHMNFGLYMHPVSHMDPDCYISASAYHNMVRTSAPVPFHHLFLTALVHPLSTCAYLLLLSHCTHYILPSDSRQPKLASCFILSSGWGIFPIPPLFPQPACFSMASGWGIFPIPPLFPKPACFPMASGWGIFPIPPLFPQPACFPMASGWGIFPIPPLFPQSACFPMASGWGIFPILPLFPQPACLSYASGWGIFPIPPLFPQPACKQACSDACAWLVAPDNPAGFRLHITGTSSPLRSDSVSVIPQIHAFACKQACSDACAWAIITQKSPRAMWSSAGLLEKGVDYKFHVREFMFRCS